MRSEEGAILWFTGLSGAGKTTIAENLQALCKSRGILPVLLDGDEIREVTRQAGFDEAARKAHNLRVGQLAALFEAQGHLVIVSLISPYEDVRRQVRKLSRNFIEIYIDTPLTVCIERDPKGLYEKALRNVIREFTGISAPYEAPSNPDIRISTPDMMPQQASELIWSHYKNIIQKAE